MALWCDYLPIESEDAVFDLKRLFALVCLCSLACAGCGDDDNSRAAGEPVAFRPASTGDTPFGDIPWPSDLYIDSDGTVGDWRAGPALPTPRSHHAGAVHQ